MDLQPIHPGKSLSQDAFCKAGLAAGALTLLPWSGTQATQTHLPNYQQVSNLKDQQNQVRCH